MSWTDASAVIPGKWHGTTYQEFVFFVLMEFNVQPLFVSFAHTNSKF